MFWRLRLAFEQTGVKLQQQWLKMVVFLQNAGHYWVKIETVEPWGTSQTKFIINLQIFLLLFHSLAIPSNIMDANLKIARVIFYKK